MAIQPISSASSVYAVTNSTPNTANPSESSEKSGQKKMAAPPTAPPPCSGCKAGGGGTQAASDSSSSDSSSSSSSAKIYDPRDTNQDGVVSAQEALKYALTHPDDESEDPTTSASQLQTGLSAYKQSQ